VKAGSVHAALPPARRAPAMRGQQRRPASRSLSALSAQVAASPLRACVLVAPGRASCERATPARLPTPAASRRSSR